MRLHPVHKDYRLHSGIDLISNKGRNIPILSIADGTVRMVVTTKDGYGKYIIITHTINNEKYESVYAHLQSFSVSIGEKVKQGQQIGIMGTTGTSTGVHLHFEIHNNKYDYGKGTYPNTVDPLTLISLSNEKKEVIDLSKVTIKDMNPTLKRNTLAFLNDAYNKKHFNDKDWIKQAENGTLSIIDLVGLKILSDSKK